MKKYIIRNEKQLIEFLSSHRCNYQVINDGWDVQITVNNLQEFFNIGKMFGDYLTTHSNLLSIEELQQRGDIPGI